MRTDTWAAEPSGIHVRVDAGCLTIEVSGDVDLERARQVVEVAGAAAAGRRSVAIDLQGVGSISEEAAAALLFGTSLHRNGVSEITLRTGGQPSRQAVLRAYARRRARNTSIA